MPPKTRITKEMVLSAAFEIIRADGIENLSARVLAKRLGCSTQPIMYIFATIDELKRAVYEKADVYHTEYLLNIDDPEEIMLGIGQNYIRFAVREPNLFRFLFQSGCAAENNLLEMIESEEIAPILAAMQEAMGLNAEQTKAVFISLAVFAHGYASIIANNSLEYDEDLVISHLSRAYRGAILAVEEEGKENEENN